ncbi:MAG TPA: hypothetical protein VGN86_01120 [Pyrinomonadaceae bacterium]|jgi:hypothetical protein|nr:hypothetical protein [Pyrinomonadaceae bacterium]
MLHNHFLTLSLISAACFLSVVSGPEASGQRLNISTLVPAQQPNSIELIRQRYSDINKKVGRYRKVKKELSGFSAEGGELVAFFQGNGVMKLIATYYGETGRTIEEFYYWEGALIFAFRKQLTYDRPLSGKVVRTEAQRFYFENNKLIRWVNQEKKEVSSSDGDFVTNETDYLNTSQTLLTGARGKATTIEAP